MLINELRMKNLQVGANYSTNVNEKSTSKPTKPQESQFAKQLQEKINKSNGVEFSKHAIERINLRGVNLETGNTLERLNNGVKIAQEKGSSETLVLVDQNAFVVNVKNNKVITTMGQTDMLGNIFTNIDSTVIM